MLGLNTSNNINKDELFKDAYILFDNFKINQFPDAQKLYDRFCYLYLWMSTPELLV